MRKALEKRKSTFSPLGSRFTHTSPLLIGSDNCHFTEADAADHIIRIEKETFRYHIHRINVSLFYCQAFGRTSLTFE